jgi:catalase
VPAIRQRTVSMLRNVSDELAQRVADGIGIKLPKPMPRLVAPSTPEVTVSPALSLTALPGDGSIRGRKIAILVAADTEGRAVAGMAKSLGEAGAVVRLIAARLGTVAGGELEADATLETMPSVLFDAVIVPDGQGAAAELSSLGQALEFLKDQYRHCKPILMLGAGESVAAAAGIPLDDPQDWAVVRELPAFVEAVGRHRNWDRALDPPPV